jgi:hypothetical protein
MNIEDENWVIDDRLTGSKQDRLKGCAKFFEIPPIELSSALSRRNSIMGESNFKDFRDYCKGTVTDFSVLNIIQNMDKVSHFGSINSVILRNIKHLRENGHDCKL